MALGYLAGYCGIQGWPQFPPAESTQWFPWIVVAVAILCVALLSETQNTWWYWLLALLALALALYLLLLPAFQYSWGLAEGLGRLSVLVAASLFFWAGLLFESDREQTSAVAVVFLIVTGGIAFIVGVSGSVILSQLATVQTSTLGAGLIITLWRGKSVLEYAGLLHLVLLSGLIVSGWYFVDVSVHSAVVLIAVPWLALRISRRVPEAWPAWAYLLTVITVSFVAVSMACYIAVISSPPLDVEF